MERAVSRYYKKDDVHGTNEDLLQTLQQLVQDVIAPDVRELKVRVASLEKQIEVRFNALDQKNDAQFKAVMSAIAESKAQPNSPACA